MHGSGKDNHTWPPSAMNKLQLSSCYKCIFTITASDGIFVTEPLKPQAETFHVLWQNCRQKGTMGTGAATCYSNPSLTCFSATVPVVTHD